MLHNSVINSQNYLKNQDLKQHRTNCVTHLQHILLNHGARISDVSELLGHETMATTQVYTKLGSVKKDAGVYEGTSAGNDVR